MAWFIEETDLAGGELNYDWVKRFIIDDPARTYNNPQYNLTRIIKKLTKHTGDTGKLLDYSHNDSYLWHSGDGTVGVIANWFDDEDIDNILSKYNDIRDRRS